MMPSLASDQTGVHGLDSILGGGLPRRGIVFVIGAPGTGKTLLAQQIAFAAARAGRPVLYFSGLSEPHERLVEHLRPFSFFDETRLGEQVQFLSLQSALEEGADAAVATVTQTARRARASLVIVDGFLGLRALLADERDASGFLYRLGTQIGVLGGLLIVALEGDPRAEEFFPELTSSDILLGMFFERAVVGHRRYIEVLKRRGAAHLSGLHALTIGREGVSCYPQFETTVATIDAPLDPAARTGFGSPDLDAMLGGGLTRQTSTMLAGNPGTGKTALALQFLAEGVARGEPGLLLSFREPPRQILARASAFGMDLAGAVDRGMLRLVVQPPIAIDPDVLAHRVEWTIAEAGVRRLVVDSVADFVATVGRERIYSYLAAMLTMVRGRGVTALLTRETSNLFGLQVEHGDVPTSGLYDNIVVLQHVETGGQLCRFLSVLKMRFSDYDRSIREFTLADRGLVLLPREGGPRGTPGILAERRSDPSRSASPPSSGL